MIANIHKELFWKKLPGLLNWLKKQKVSLIFSNRIVEHKLFTLDTVSAMTEEELTRHCDMLLAFGGDGTMLHTVQLVGGKETPVLGINVGGLGFLTEIPLGKFTSAFESILRGEYRIEKRLIIKAIINDDPKPLYGLNEIVLDKGNSVRVIQIRVEVNQQLLNSYVADGLLISTPTGSTGYSLAVGGPIVVPTSHVFIINPISPHSLTNRPVIIPADASIATVVRTEYPEFIVGADGRDVRFCKTRTKIVFNKAEFCANLVKPLNSNFLKILHGKLNWGEDFRNKKRWSHHS